MAVSSIEAKTVAQRVLSCVAVSALGTMAASADLAAESMVAANGRLEGGEPTAELHFAESGRIAAVLVVEGQVVKKGDRLALLDCTALSAELKEAQAQLAIAKRGGRPEAVSRQQAEVDALRAEARRYEAQVRRLVDLAARDLAARSALEDAELALRAVNARRVVAERGLKEISSPLPKQERTAAAARVDSLSARIEECEMKAPADGLILRRLREPGAAVSQLTPAPVLLFTSAGEWHVRAEVDENDIGRISAGQEALVTAPGFGDVTVRGRVVRMSSLMGRRSVMSGDPGEKMDRDVREVLVRLDNEPPAPVVGLRVKVRFRQAGETQANAGGRRAR